MRIRRGHVYVVDLNPRVRTRPGKIRPAVVLQDDLLNEASYPSTIVLPTTTSLVETTSPLRLRLPAGAAGLERESDVLVAQMIAIANESFRKELGVLPGDLFEELAERPSSGPRALRSAAGLHDRPGPQRSLAG